MLLCVAHTASDTHTARAVASYGYARISLIRPFGLPTAPRAAADRPCPWTTTYRVWSMDRYDRNMTHFGLGSTSHPSLRPQNSLRKHVHTGVVDGMVLAT